MSLFQKLMTTDIPTTQSGYPLTINKSSGARNLIDYSVTGNSSQTGTPTPEAPIEVTSVGDKTENLFDKSLTDNLIAGYLESANAGSTTSLRVYAAGDKTIRIPVKPNTQYTIKRVIGISSVYDRIRVASATSYSQSSGLIMLINVMNRTDETATFTTLADTAYIYANVRNTGTVGEDWQQYLNGFMLVEGSTVPTEYIPYGYKIPIVVNGTTQQTIYLNNPLRKIGTYADYIDYKNQQVIRNIGVTTLSAGTHTLADAVSNGTYLCTQQESGTLSGQDITLNTGVTNAIVYYPLATPTTESITIPALTVNSGTNTITTGTELAPSNLSSKTWTWRF